MVVCGGPREPLFRSAPCPDPQPQPTTADRLRTNKTKKGRLLRVGPRAELLPARGAGVAGAVGAHTHCPRGGGRGRRLLAGSRRHRVREVVASFGGGKGGWSIRLLCLRSVESTQPTASHPTTSPPSTPQHSLRNQIKKTLTQKQKTKTKARRRPLMGGVPRLRRRVAGDGGEQEEAGAVRHPVRLDPLPTVVVRREAVESGVRGAALRRLVGGDAGALR